MPGRMATLTDPNQLQLNDIAAKIKELRDNADSLDTQAQSTEPLGSWTQVLAHVLQGFVAGKERKSADSQESSAQAKLVAAMAAARAGFQQDQQTLTPEQLHLKYAGNSAVKDLLEPYDKAFGAGMNKHAEEVNSTVETPDQGLQWKGSQIGRVPTDPNKLIIPNPNGGWEVNGLKVTGDRAAQANGPAFYGQTTSGLNGAIPPLTLAPSQAPSTQTSASATPAAFTPANISQRESGGHDFNPDGSPMKSVAGAMYGMQVMPSTAAQPGYGVPPVPANIMALPDRDPRRAAAFDNLGTQYALAMQRRYGNNPTKAAAAYNGGPGRTDHAIATSGGNFLQSMPGQTQAYANSFTTPAPAQIASKDPGKPDGMTKDGRPFWLINGTPYDNPNGQ